MTSRTLEQNPRRGDGAPAWLLAAACAAFVACNHDPTAEQPASLSLTTSSTQAEYCPADTGEPPTKVLIVDANPGLTPTTEIQAIENILTSLGYEWSQIDEPRTAGVEWYADPGITPAQLQGYDVIVYNTKGWRWHSAESRDTLMAAIEQGKRVFIIGDDSAWGIPDLEPLTHLTGSGYANNGELYPSNTSVTVVPNTVLSAGPSGAAQSFTYQYDVDVAQTTGQGETIYATVRGGAPAIIGYSTPSGARVIVSLVGVAAAEGAASNAAGLASLAKLFQNGIAHLSAPGSCDVRCPPSAPLVGADGASCVAECASGTYDDGAGRCVTACPVYHTDTTCVETCPAGTMPDSTTGACVDSCSQFIDQGVCVAECPIVRRGRYCVDSCPAFRRGRVCVSSCPVYVRGNVCVAQCPAGTFLNPTNNHCVNRCPAETAPDANGVCQEKIATTVTVTQRTNPNLFVGVPTNYRVRVRDADGNVPSTGTVTVRIDGAVVTTAPIGNGIIDVSHTFETEGQHVLRANYVGAGYKGSSFRNVFETKARVQETFITLTTNPTEAVAGQNITFTATVVTADGTPVTNGRVTISEGGSGGWLGRGPVNAQGVFSFQKWMASTTWSLWATYEPGPGYLGSSTTAQLVVLKADTHTSVTVSPNPIPPGSNWMFTIATTALPPSDFVGHVGPPGLTGYRCFFDNVEFVCADGDAALSPIAPGTHELHVLFVGTSMLNPSTATVQVIQQ